MYTSFLTLLQIYYKEHIYGRKKIKLNIAEKYYKYGLSTNRGKENPNNLNTYKLNRIYVYRSYNLNQFINAF